MRSFVALAVGGNGIYIYIYKAVGVRLIGRFVSAGYIYNIIIIKHILYIDRLNKMAWSRGGTVLNLKMVGEGILLSSTRCRVV